MQKKRELIKQFTRDFSLFVCEWWRESLRINFQRTMGACYKDYIIVSDGRSVTTYYFASDLKDITLALMRRIASDKTWYFRASRQFRRDCVKSRGQIKKTVKAGVLNRKVFLQYRMRHLRLFPMLRYSVLIPTLSADEFRSAFGSLGDRIIKRAYQDRVLSDGLFEANDFSLRVLVSKHLVKIGVPGTLAKFLTADEVLALASGKKIDLKLIRRLAGGYVLCKKGLIQTKDYKKVFSQCHYYFREEKPTKTVVTGTVAYSSKAVRGRVRLLFALEQIYTFKKGEVLVTPMTVPDFVPAMKKAAAIVTDEGGITCHAAIVSRELKIPCIIGTKHATKVFKDGDTVEVDATKGIVRKL